MKIVWALVAILSLLFWGFAALDLWATLTAWPPYQAQYGAEMFAWVQNFPLWRKAIWGLSIALGVIGSLMMFARLRLAGPALLGALVLMAAGLAYDLAVQDGASNYGQQGLIASGVLVALAALFAWAGYASARRASQSSKAAIQPTASRAAHAPATPDQSVAPTPVASPPDIVAPTPAAPEAAVAPALKDASPTPPEADDTIIQPPAAVENDEPLSTPSTQATPDSPRASQDNAPSPTASEPPEEKPKPPAQ